MNNFELEKIVNKKLNSNQYNDVIPNGLQIEGRPKIKKIVTGVTACQLLIDLAISNNAHGIIVHHGLFWDNHPKIIKGIYRHRIKSILANNINLYSWHFPLDVHPILGNNAQIGHILNINVRGYIKSCVPWGMLKEPIKSKDMSQLITQKFHRVPFYYGNNITQNIHKIAWCSGKGQKFINFIPEYGVDTFLTGEVSEETIHFAHENKLHFFSIGHHASEINGIKALTNWLKIKFSLDINFINIDNPI
ncbi:conserved hypothetical protein [Buchnera aphidicola str. Bp (Baizongia pistaciae)]|uniref:GTP cyclohydrolase 1 type 2 homolog n=1 Tax=Buchnera aphidicola subsp. Baizongia pistaciae (strain Bp) TaxID=224915 RepID=GCH1L_BUCBP|nr:Nif3-like dinuclear metal center hexameric protein [Buchnera aphidicola]Q89AJ8.1 RecName: Full=GTP cyclohydrolase 1 type 2 homolog [Buchnera aphidicola str. Bp (Baizongia pistaciae)]AAO27004.1 conserved hypothetical protein [Buchnera aphidicola str. Bp (Baizongia pistaciae)]